MGPKFINATVKAVSIVTPHAAGLAICTYYTFSFFEPRSDDACSTHSELFNLCGWDNNLENILKTQWKTLKNHFQRSLSTGSISPHELCTLSIFLKCFWHHLLFSIFRINAVSEYAKGLAALPALLNTSSTSRIGHIEPYGSILTNDKLIKTTPLWTQKTPRLTMQDPPRLQESAQLSSRDTPHDLPR